MLQTEVYLQNNIFLFLKRYHFSFKFDLMNSFYITLPSFSLRHGILQNDIDPFTRNYGNNMAYNYASSEINGFNVTPMCKYVLSVVFHAVLCHYVRVLLIVYCNNFLENIWLEHIAFEQLDNLSTSIYKIFHKYIFNTKFYSICFRWQLGLLIVYMFYASYFFICVL